MYQLLDFRKDKSIPHVRYGIYDYNQPIERTAVFLPMPGGLETSDESEYEEEDNWGLVAAGVAGSTVGITRQAYEKGSGGGGLLGGVKGVAEATKTVIGTGLSVGAKLMGSISPTARSLARGKTKNLNKEHFFKGIGFRTFSFTHTLNADNHLESVKIQNIIKTLREAGAPGISGEFFTWPSDIKPRFYSGESHDEMTQYGGTIPRMTENEWLPAIQRCIIKSVGVDYSSQEPYHQHADGAPTIVVLTLELEEIRQQTREVINLGHKGDYTRPTIPEKYRQKVEENAS